MIQVVSICVHQFCFGIFDNALLKFDIKNRLVYQKHLQTHKTEQLREIQCK